MYARPLPVGLKSTPMLWADLLVSHNAPTGEVSGVNVRFSPSTNPRFSVSERDTVRPVFWMKYFLHNTDQMVVLCWVAQVAEYSGVWDTICLDVPPLRHGVLLFSVQITRIDGAAGVAVGIALAGELETRVDILGARPHTWAYSKTGNKGAGRFEPYGEPYSLGDVITTEVDANARTVR
jgi:hypothetical protein